MNWHATYKRWAEYENLDKSLKAQLEAIKDSDKDLEDAFYQELTFGTGGMRGTLGPGTNRMNIYTVRKAVKGLAKYLEESAAVSAENGVAVAYDSRYMSKEFAIETARVLGVHGIPTYVFESLRPTPVLSFAVRHLNAAAGIMITASHNPPEYNGFKVYNEDGGQLPPEPAAEVIAKVTEIEDELQVEVLDQAEVENKGLLKWIGKDVDKAYLELLKGITKQSDEEKSNNENLKIVFTPLHGTAYDLVLRGLEQLNFTQVHVVEEQAKPDPEFSTVKSPNPEEHQAFELAIKQGQEIGADILIGTDPDADRLGVAVQDGSGSYRVLTGNQLGTLMLDYLLSQSDEKIGSNHHLIKTIVTTELGRKVASHYGANTIDTLTGFKYIAEKIRQFENNENEFVFGYEESYGYLVSGFVRDKDAVQAAMTASEMASYWKAQGKTLLDALEVLYEQHGYYFEGMSSLTLKGKEGAEQIGTIMKEIRKNPLREIGGLKVQKVEDYQSQKRTFLESETEEVIELPVENVVKYLLDNDSWVCLRPSGTEPKIKCYFGVSSSSREESSQLLDGLKKEMNEQIDSIINA